MKILVLADKRRYVNPARELFLEGLRKDSQIILHGPGYGPTSRSIHQLSKKLGRFDLIFVDDFFFFAYGTASMRLYAPPNELAWPIDLFDYNAPMLVMNLTIDPHGYVKEHLDKFVNSNVFLLGTATSPQFYKRLSPDDYAREPWLSPDAYFFQHPEAINERYLLFPHFVAENEFMVPKFGRYKYDVSIMGVDYYFRKQAGDKIITDGQLKFKMLDFVQKVLRLLVFRKNLSISLYRKRFMKIVNDSLCSVTCAGTVGYPIRKFFEIPAYGSLLMAEFFENPEALGFKDRENCFYLDVDNLDTMIEIIKALKRDPKWARQIIEAGQQMVRDCHTVQIRVQQFFEIADAVITRRLKTTRWENGRQIIIER